MPIISNIGRRSWKVRGVYAVIFTVLTLGGLTMVYPFGMMIAGSFKSETDSEGLSIYPEFWFDDVLLYKKYLEARYTLVDQLEAAHHRFYGSWRRAEPVSQLDQEWVDAYRAYRDQADWPASWYFIAQSQSDRFFRLHARGYRKMLSDRFGGRIEALNAHYGTGYVTWEQVAFANEQLHSRRYRSAVNWPDGDFRSTFDEYKRTVPPLDRVPVNLDGYGWHTYLRTIYPKLQTYNEAHETDHNDYRMVLLGPRAPASGLAREDWEQFVRDELNLSFIRLDAAVKPAYRAFLAQADQYGDIASYNKIHGTNHDDFDQVPVPLEVPDYERAQEDMSSFIADREACELEHIEVRGPRQHFLEYVAANTNTNIDPTLAAALPLPLAEADHADLIEHKDSVRWEETRRNYLHVFDYVALHGNAVRNTIIYCGLMILATLLVNPLGAYALSRYRPPSQYKVLLICMATMAFPGEVTMIPAFLLLKKFPLFNLAAGVAVCAAVLWIGFRKFPKGSEAIIGLSAVAAGVLGGWWLAPQLAGLFGRDTSHVSLLNTFWALVLPSMANGYGLFLLKGFFDSLPRELYESADIDGASEWTKFWSLTMALSKPILAVLALGAFTAAYSEFMMALIIIPDRDMWTLMVWVFQLQIGAPQAVVHASVLIAAVPTFIVFIFCQNIIIRGIVVPVEK